MLVDFFEVVLSEEVIEFLDFLIELYSFFFFFFLAFIVREFALEELFSLLLLNICFLLFFPVFPLDFFFFFEIGDDTFIKSSDY